MDALMNKPILMAPASPEQIPPSQDSLEDPLSEVQWTSDEEEIAWAPRKRRRSETYPLTQQEMKKSSVDLLQAFDDEDQSLKSANLFNSFLKHLCHCQFQQDTLEKLLKISTVLVRVTTTLINFNSFSINLCNVLLLIYVVCYRGASKQPGNGAQGL